jgi:hypothetical protein
VKPINVGFAVQCRTIPKLRGKPMQAYFIKCINKQLGTEAISTRLFYFYDQAIEIVDTLNAKKDGYEYFLHAATI